MESKRLIEIIGEVNKRSETMQSDINQIKLELAKNERVTKLEIKMASVDSDLRVMRFLVSTVIAAVVIAIVTYLATK